MSEVSPRFLSRRHDPPTSKEAALGEFENQRIRLLLGAAEVRNFTHEEAGARAGLTGLQAVKRMSELLNHLGWVEKIYLRGKEYKWPLTSGCPGQIYRLSEKGWWKVQLLRRQFGLNPMPIPQSIIRRSPRSSGPKRRRKSRADTDRRLCLDAFYEWDGLTREECADRTPLTYRQVDPRISELLDPPHYFNPSYGPLIEVILLQSGKRSGKPMTRFQKMTGGYAEVHRITSEGERYRREEY